MLLGRVLASVRVLASAAEAEVAIAETAAIATRVRRALRLMELVMLVMSLSLSELLSMCAQHRPTRIRSHEGRPLILGLSISACGDRFGPLWPGTTPMNPPGPVISPGARPCNAS